MVRPPLRRTTRRGIPARVVFGAPPPSIGGQGAHGNRVAHQVARQLPDAPRDMPSERQHAPETARPRPSVIDQEAEVVVVTCDHVNSWEQHHHETTPMQDLAGSRHAAGNHDARRYRPVGAHHEGGDPTGRHRAGDPEHRERRPDEQPSPRQRLTHKLRPHRVAPRRRPIRPKPCLERGPNPRRYLAVLGSSDRWKTDRHPNRSCRHPTVPYHPGLAKQITDSFWVVMGELDAGEAWRRIARVPADQPGPGAPGSHAL